MIDLIALATWLVIAPNGTREVWDIEPTPGVNAPKDSKVVPLKKGTAERDLYFVQDDGEIKRPDPPVVVPMPSTERFLEALAEDANVNTGLFLVAFKVAKIRNPVKRQEVWTALTKALSDLQKQKLVDAATAANLGLQ